MSDQQRSQYPNRQTKYPQRGAKHYEVQKVEPPSMSSDQDSPLPQIKKVSKGGKLIGTLIWWGIILWIVSDFLPSSLFDQIWSGVEEVVQEKPKPQNAVPPQSASVSIPQKPEPVKKVEQPQSLKALIKQARNTLFKERKYPEAEAMLQQALKQAEALGQNHSRYIETLNLLIIVSSKLKKHDQAISYLESYRALLEARDQGKGKLSPSVYLRYAWVYRQAGKYEEALAAAQKALEKSRSNEKWRKRSPIYKSYQSMAYIYRAWGRKNEMEIYARMAIDALNEAPNVKEKTRRRVLKRLEKMLDDKTKFRKS